MVHGLTIFHLNSKMIHAYFGKHCLGSFEKLLANDERQIADDDRRRMIAKGHMNNAGELKTKTFKPYLPNRFPFSNRNNCVN